MPGVKLPTLTPVKSSNIEAVGHGAHGLFVQFKGGGIYQYLDAPASLHKEMLAAESVGSFFRSRVKGRYPHVRHDHVKPHD